jgi:hypothetical protein
MYGMDEDSYLVPNITRKDTVEVGLMFDQESVIWASRVGDGRNKRMVWQFIEGTRTMITRDVSLSGKDIQSRKDYYSIVRGRKFLIPFFDEKYSISARRKAAAAKTRTASNRTLLASPRSAARGNPTPDEDWYDYFINEELFFERILGEDVDIYKQSGGRLSGKWRFHNRRYDSPTGYSSKANAIEGAKKYIKKPPAGSILRELQERKKRKNPSGFTGSAAAREGKVMYRPVVVMADGSKRRPRMYLEEESEGIKASKNQRSALSKARGTLSLVGEPKRKAPVKKAAAKKAPVKKAAAKKAPVKKAAAKKAPVKKAAPKTRALHEVAKSMDVQTKVLVEAMEAANLKIGSVRLKALSRVTPAMEKKISAISLRRVSTAKKATAKKAPAKKAPAKKAPARKATSGSAARRTIAARAPASDLFPDKDKFLVAAEVVVVEETPRKGPPPYGRRPKK